MTIRPFFRFPALGSKTKLLLALALAVVMLVLLFDWNWLRRPLELYLMDRSGREVRIEDLHVELGYTLQPAVRLRGVYVENAPWAAKRPLVTAAEASFTVSLASVWRGRPVISRLVLMDASVDLERQADGLRNWRLRDPEDRSPGRVTVMTLEAHRTQLRFVNRAIDLDFVASAAPLDSQSAGPDRDSLSTRVSFEGSYQGSAFAGEALGGSVLSFRDSGISFPLRGYFVSRRTRLDFDGFFTDLFDIGPMDARVRLVGPSLSLLHPFLRIRPVASRPYAVEAQLTQTYEVFHFARLAGKIGGTSVMGEVVYDRSAERPMLRAALSSDAADFDDIRPLIGMHALARNPRPESSHAGDAADVQRERRDTEPHGQRLFPTRPFRVGALRALDMRITVTLDKLAVAGQQKLEDVRLGANLSEGLLHLNPLHVRVAGGRFTGSFMFDSRQDAPSAQVSGELRGIRIERLVPRLAAKSGSAGSLNGQIDLSGRGNSIAAMVGNSAGSFAATLDGGRISNLADAKLGLNIGKLVSVFLRGDREIAIHCGAAAFEVRDGVAKSRRIVLDTEQTHVEGSGAISLREERLDLLLTPEPKKPGLFTRRASIRIRGPMRAPAVAIEDRGKQAVRAQQAC